MADERIDIEIGDKVSPNVRKKVLEIADAARRADSAVMKLKSQLASVDETALNKLANASAKVTNALARETNVNARLTSANARMSDATNRAALSQQKLATETARTTAAQQRASVASANAAAAQSRAELAALRLKVAQDKLNNSTERSNRSLGSFIRTAAAFAGISFGGAAIVQASDAYTVLENKLRNVVDSERQLVTVTKEVFDVANRTRAPVQDTAQAFQRFDLALKQLGASQQESLQLTETVNKALVLSGSTTNEQASALLQLSQAFNKGKLDGDEFRTVMELMPSVADAIAKQLKVTRGELLELAPQGKITAQVMRDAFANAREEIAGKFAKTIPTLGQSFVVLKNSATQFFGEINKRLGITEAMSKGFLFLADNMKAVGVALAALTAALLVAFGPAILAGIGAATTAVKAFTLAIAANPIGALIVGLTTAIALFAAFKDDIKVSEDGVVSLGDTFTAVFQIIGEVIAPVVNFFKDVWNSAFNEVEGRASGFVGILGDALRNVVSIGKTIVNGYIALWVGAFNSIVQGWQLFPAALKDIVVGAMNFVIGAVETGINGVLNKLKSLLELANNAAEFLGANPIFNTDFSVDLSRFKGELSGAATELGNVFSDQFSKAFNTDFVGDAVSAVSERARKIANERIANEQGADAPLRGEGNAPLRGEGAGAPLRGEGNAPAARQTSDQLKAAQKRADALAKVNRELDSELKLLGLLGPQRELQIQFEQINNELLNKKITLTKDEASAIMNKLQTLQREKGIQEELNNIYESTFGQFQRISDGITAANSAYAAGIISADNYAQRLVMLNVEASKLRATMGDGTWADSFLGGLARVVEGYQGTIPAMSEAFGNLFTQLTDGFANSLGQAIVYGEDLDETLRNVARGALAELISSIIKMGIQWVITEGLKQGAIAATTAATKLQGATTIATTTAATAAQTTALATTTAASTTAATTTTTAWTPAATTASIGSFGGAAAIGLAAVLAAIAAAKGGFERGGFTGGGGRREIAGVVHGQEFVMDAATTSRIGTNNLEALRTGVARVQRNGSQAGEGRSAPAAAPAPAPVVNVPINAAVVQNKDAALAALKSSEGKSFIIEAIEENAGTVAKVIGVK